MRDPADLSWLGWDELMESMASAPPRWAAMDRYLVLMSRLTSTPSQSVAESAI